MEDLDNAMDVLDSMDKRDRGEVSTNASGEMRGKVLIGKVDHFFDHINVVAIQLTGDLSVGDIIEIGSEEEAVRQKVESMQINRKEIKEAHAGDDVGIKIAHRVQRGSSVYKISN